jgi:hypothetical protein
MDSTRSMQRDEKGYRARWSLLVGRSDFDWGDFSFFANSKNFAASTLCGPTSRTTSLGSRSDICVRRQFRVVCKAIRIFKMNVSGLPSIWKFVHRNLRHRAANVSTWTSLQKGMRWCECIRPCEWGNVGRFSLTIRSTVTASRYIYSMDRTSRQHTDCWRFR